MAVELYIVTHMSGRAHHGPVKIGISANPEARLRELQTGNPLRLGVFWTFTFATRWEAREHERAFHEEFARDQTSGEWFAITPERAINMLCVSMRLATRKMPQSKAVLR